MVSRGAGRPRSASKELLQEAAFELFQVRGYRNTSIELITRTAGYSRATFFNFFSSKAELFWVETDQLLSALSRELEANLHEGGQPNTLPQVLLGFADQLNGSDIPWALQNYELLEAADDLVASGASRVLSLNRLFAHYLAHRTDLSNRGNVGVEAAVLTALLLTALRNWIDAGVSRGSLRSSLLNAFKVNALG